MNCNQGFRRGLLKLQIYLMEFMIFYYKKILKFKEIYLLAVLFLQAVLSMN